MAEHAAGPRLLFIDGSVERQRVFLAPLHGAAVFTAEVSLVSLCGDFVGKPRVFRHAQRNHEGALNFDCDVRQGVEGFFVGAFVKADGSAVRAPHGEV